MKQLLIAACLCMASLCSLAQAPSVTLEPVDATTCAGTDTSFILTATGTSLAYQWQVNMGGFFLNLSDDGFHSGSNNDTLHIVSPDGILNGLQYRCVVSGSVAPNDTSAVVTLTVIEPPTVNVQPNFAAICAAGNANFSVAASGASLSYQWQETTNGTLWSNVTNGGVFSNATSAALDITGAGASMNDRGYRCIVSNSCGNDTSAAASLFVDQAMASTVAITASPGDTACSGGVSITASLTNAAALNTYLWQVNGAYVTAFDSVFSSPTFVTGDSIQSIVIVNNACTGLDTIYSNKIGLTLFDALVISSTNTDTLVCEGSGAGFSVSATGTGLMYQWLIDSNGVWMPLTDGATYIGTGTSTLSLSATTLDMDSNLFALEISGDCGTDTTAASVLHIEKITAPAISISVSPGGTLCETPALQDVIWTNITNSTVTGTTLDKTGGSNNTWDAGANSQQLIDNGGHFQFENGQNNRDHSIALSNVATAPGVNGDFNLYCRTGGSVQIYESGVFQGNYGSYNANSVFKIAVENNTVVYYRDGVVIFTSGTAPTLPLFAEVELHDVGASITDVMVQPYTSEITFTAVATDLPVGASYQWYSNGLPVGTNDTSYVTTSAQNTDSVTCEIVYNSACLGNSSTPSNSIILTMDPATLVLTPPADFVGCEGASTVVGLVAQGSGLTYQWQIDTNGTWVNLIADATYSNVTTDSLTVSGLSTAMTGNSFRAIVQGVCDTIFSEGAELTVNPNNPGINIVVTPPYATCSEPQMAPITWKDPFTATAVGNTLTKTSGTNGFNSGGSSVEAIYPGAELTYTITEVMTAAVGMSQSDPDGDLFSIGHAWYFTNTNRLFVYDHGVNYALVTINYMVGDELGLVVGDDSVSYYYNGNLAFQTVIVDPFPWTVDATIWSGSKVLTGVELGNLPLFTANLSGVPDDYSLSWYANGTLVDDSVAVLSTGQVSTGDTITAELIIPGSCSGVDTIGSNPIVLQSLENPAITGHPQDTATCINSQIELGISASGAGLLYQWQIDTAGVWEDVSNSLIFQDANTDTLSIVSATADLDGAQLRCTVTGTCGTETSNAATLTIETPLAVSLDVQVSPGLTACADLVSPVPVIWTNFDNTSANGSELTKSGGTNDFDGGAASENVVLEGGYVEYTLNNNTDYRAVGLSHVDTSNNLNSIDYAFYLTGTGKVFYYLAGTNMGQLGNYNGGDQFRFGYNAGVVTGYQNDTVIFTEPGVTGDSLLADVSIVTVGSKIDTAEIGSPPIFTASVTNNPLSFAFSWYVNGVEIATNTDEFSTFNLNDNDTVTCKLEYTQLCAGLDSIWSAPFVMDIGTTTAINTQPVAADICAGTDTAFHVTAVGDSVDFQWQIDTNGTWVDIVNDATFSGSSDSSLILSAVADSLDGSYFRCVVTGICGTVWSDSAALSVEPNLPIVLDVQVSPGLTACPELTSPQPVVWANFDNTGLTGDTLIKTGGTNDFDGGAASANYVLEGGYVEYTLDNNTDYRVVGISHVDTSNNLNSIDYAFYLTGTGKVFLYLAGVSQGQVATYNGGDQFRFDYSNGTLTATQNGTVHYTDNSITGDSLVADVSIVTIGSVIDNAVIGSPPVFTASVTNNPSSVGYTWYINSVEAATGTDVFSTFNLANSDTVTCKVVFSSLCTGLDSLWSTPFVLDIRSSTQITSHPVDVAICGGTDTAFHVTATGSNLTYQWQLDSSGTWIDLGNDATFSGTTDSSLIVTAVPDSMNGHMFRCLVAGDCGDSLSTVATMLVDNAGLPTVTVSANQALPLCLPNPVGDTLTWTSLNNVTANGSELTKTSSSPSFNAGAVSNEIVYDGGNITFLAGNAADYRAIGLSAGDTGPDLLDIEFAFYLAGTSEIFIYESGVSYGNFGNYTGTDEFSMQLTGGVVTFWQNGTLLHTATNAPTAPSLVVDVSLWSPGMMLNNIEIFNPPVFTASVTDQPSSSSFQWFVNGVPVGDDAPTYASSGVVDGDTVVCEMAFSNLCFGNDTVASNNFVMLVNPNTAVTAQPGDVVVCEGNDTTFVVVADGTNLTYVWQIDTTGSWDTLIASAIFSNVTSDTLMLTGIPASLTNAEFRCLVTGDCSNDVSDAASLSVDENVLPTVTVAIDQALPLCVPSVLEQAVTWTNLSGTDTSGTTLTKNIGTSAWDAGASTIERVWDGGYVEAVIDNASTYRTFGLTVSDDNQDINDIERAFYVAGNGQLFIYENGLNVSGSGSYSVGDVLRIEIDGNVTRYFQNGSQIFTNNTGTNPPYVVDVTVFSPGGFISDVIVSNPPIFSAVVTDLPSTASYQWTYNGANVGTDTYEYSQPSLTDGDSIGVVMSYSNACIGASSATSPVFEVQVSDNTVINTQPQDAVVCPGTDTSFAVSVTGDSLLFQWQVDSTGGVWEDLTNNATYAGATDSVLQVSNTTIALEGYLFRCMVTGFCGNAVSDSAGLTVDTLPPGINMQPMNINACENSDTSLFVGVTGVGITYQWQVSTNGGTSFADVANNATYSGANAATLGLLGVADSLNGNQYRCMLGGACWVGDSSAVASVVVLTSPEIDTQPSDTIECAGSSTMFTVGATGDGLTYQWRVSTDGVSYNPIVDGVVYAGAQTDTLNITTITAGMNGFLFNCLITGTCDPAITTNNVILEVYEDPSVTTQPQAQQVCDGANASFSITADGAGLTYLWEESVNGGVVWNALTDDATYSGTTTTTLTITGATGSMEGFEYRCVVTGPCSEDISVGATLTIDPLPLAMFTYTANGGLVAFNSTSANATSYSWDFGDNGAGSTDGNTHHVYPATGTYTVMLTATNDCGSSDTTETVNIDVVGIGSVLAAAEVHVYPVPAVNELNIAFKHPTARVKAVRLESITGQVVYNELLGVPATELRKQINLGNVAAGAYFLKISTTEGQVVRKVIVE